MLVNIDAWSSREDGVWSLEFVFKFEYMRLHQMGLRNDNCLKGNGYVRVYFSPSGILKVDEIFTEKEPRRWESHVNSWGQKEGLLKFCKAHFGPGILNFVALHASQRSYPKGCCKLSG